MLIFLEVEIAEGFGGAPGDALGAGELGHEQAAAAEAANDSPEKSIRDAGHGRQHGRGGNPEIAHFVFRRNHVSYDKSSCESMGRKLTGVHDWHGWPIPWDFVSADCKRLSGELRVANGT